MLAGAAPDLEADRNARGKLGDPMIEERNARLEAHRHRRAIDFAQNVVRQVGDGVAIHHPHRVRRARPTSMSKPSGAPSAPSTGEASSSIRRGRCCRCPRRRVRR
jgi:hypothetical protein